MSSKVAQELDYDAELKREIERLDRELVPKFREKIEQYRDAAGMVGTAYDPRNAVKTANYSVRLLGEIHFRGHDIGQQGNEDDHARLSVLKLQLTEVLDRLCQTAESSAFAKFPAVTSIPFRQLLESGCKIEDGLGTVLPFAKQIGGIARGMIEAESFSALADLQYTSFRAPACKVPQNAAEFAAAISEWREAHYEFIGARTKCVPFEQNSQPGQSVETGEEEHVQSSYRKALYRLMAASDPIFHLCAANGVSSTAIRRRLDNPRNGDLSTSDEADYVIAELEAHLRAKVPIGASDPGRKAEPNRLEVSDNGNGSYTALFAGKTHPLNESKYAYLKKLLDAKGGFYSPPKGSNERPDRLRKSLPLELQAIIEAKDGSGTRLTIF